MNDNEIIELYNKRSENAIQETKKKYETYLMQIADHILQNRLDDEECVNDTYLKTWNSIPPTVPKCFRAFIGKITRNGALNRVRDEMRDKRLSNSLSTVLEELEDIVSSDTNIENEIEKRLIIETIDSYLEQLSDKKRVIFVRRYWYFDSVREIAARMGLSESNVKMTLKRQREQLKEILKKEGFYDYA